MAIAILERPQATEPNTGDISYWTACYNYVRFIFQRQDRVFATVTDVSGFARFNFSAPPPSGVTTNTPIYIQSSNGTTYNATGTVTAVSGNNITTDIPYVSSTSGFGIYPTIIKDWRVEVIIDKWNGSAYVPINGQSVSSTTPMAKFQNLPNGSVVAQIEEYLKGELSNDYSYSNSALNQLDTGGSLRYRVRYRENYYGLSAGAYDVVSDNDDVDIAFFATNSALQLKATLAPNMAQYLMIDDADADGLYMSGFEEPSIWFNRFTRSGYPFDLAFCFNLGDTLTAIQLWYDENKVFIEATSLGTLVDYNGQVSRIGVNRGTVTSNPYSYTAVQIRQSVFPFAAVGELKYIRLRETCPGTMLVWKNQLGGWDYWLFNEREIEVQTTSSGQVYEPYIEDMATADAKAVLLSKASGNSITLTASKLDENDVRGLMGLPKSIAVFVIDENGAVQYRTNVNAGTFNVFNNKRKTYDVIFTISKPTDYIQSE
jgi:hypothetical protein